MKLTQSAINAFSTENGLGEVEKIIYHSSVVQAGLQWDTDACMVRMKGGTFKLFTTGHGKVCEMSYSRLDELLQQTIKSANELRLLQEFAGLAKRGDRGRLATAQAARAKATSSPQSNKRIIK